MQDQFSFSFMNPQSCMSVPAMKSRSQCSQPKKQRCKESKLRLMIDQSQAWKLSFVQIFEFARKHLNSKVKASPNSWRILLLEIWIQMSILGSSDYYGKMMHKTRNQTLLLTARCYICCKLVSTLQGAIFNAKQLPLDNKLQ